MLANEVRRSPYAIEKVFRSMVGLLRPLHWATTLVAKGATVALM
jgi:hypothetical protein